MNDTPTTRAGDGPFRKLRRRKVVQWGAAYAAGAWALLQVFGFAADSFDWPATSKQLAMLVFAIGLPVTVVLAWYHGDRGQQHVATSELAAIAALLLLGGAVVWWWGQRSEPQPPGAAASARGAGSQPAPKVSEERNSIAVLPFLNMSSDPEQEYFSDGMSEQILDLLAKIPELRVIARTSSFAFKGKDDDVATIARRLNVAYVLEGSVRKSGNRVRITAQLIRAVDSSHLWSETYDRDLDDVFAIQDEIALAVVEQLKVTLLGERLPGRSTTNNSEAYALYLQGKYLLDQRGADSMQQAHAHLERALVLDPGYADAWAVLGSLQFARVQYGLIPRGEGLAEADAAARKALAIDSQNAEGLLAMSSVVSSRDWNWVAAGRLIGKAADLEPGNARVISAAAFHAFSMGKIDEAIALFRKTLAIDPMRPAAYRGFAMALLAHGDASEAEAAMRAALQLNPHQLSGHYWLGRAMLADGRASEALESMDSEETLVYRLTGLAIAYHALGRRTESNAALKQLASSYGDSAAYQIAEVHSYRGELDEAFAWLERAYQLHDAGIGFVKADVRQAGVRKDPRYAALLKKMNLPEA